MGLRIGVVLNVLAGSLKTHDLRQRIGAVLGARAGSLDIRLAPGGKDVRAAAENIMQAGCDVLAAGGGDGTVSTVASLLVNSGTTLAVLPLGTLNHFARDLRIPANWESAAELIFDGRSTTIDIGEMNGRFFVNNSSLGLYPSIVRQRELWERTGLSRLLAFAASTVFALRRYPFLDVHLRVDGRQFFRRSPFIFVGNNRYEVEGLRLGQRSRLDSGALALYTANRTGRLGLLRIAAAALCKRLKRNRDFEILDVHELLIDNPRRRLAVALDGEVVHVAPPLRYCIHRAALRVMVPA